jgi:hypothetical protein
MEDSRVAPDAAATLPAKLKWVFWVVLLLVGAHFTITYLALEKPFLYSDRFAYGQERGPYQYRYLMGLLMRWVEPVMARVPLPQNVPAGLRDPWMLAVGVFVFPAMVLGTFATRLSLQKFTGDPVYSCVAAFLFPLMAYFNFILPVGENYLLPYDVPSLGFFAVGMAAIVLDKRWLFYPVFALACCNRETACFLSVLFVIAYWHRGERRGALAAELLAQIAIWTSIYVGVRMYLRGIPVEHVHHLASNLRLLLHPLQWPGMAANFGFLWVIWLLGWRRMEPAWFRRAGIIVPIWLAIMIWVGVVVEIRIFGELIAYMAVAVGLVLRRGMGRDAPVRTQIA